MILIDLAEAQTELTMNARRYSVESFAGGLGEVLWVDELIKVSNAIDLLRKLPEAVVRCKDCKHFETDHFENVNGIPLIVAHEICVRCGDGCKTSPDGYCFMGERKEE